MNITYNFKVDGFYNSTNYYRSETPMNINSMPPPVATDINGLTYIDTTAQDARDYYVRFGSIKNEDEKLSQEIVVKSDDLAPIIVGITASSFTTSVSQTKALPSGIQAGDLLVALIMHRSAIIVPSGWILVDTAEAISTPTLQYCSVLKKVASPSDASSNQTFSQASSSRMSVALMAFRHAKGCSIVDLTKSERDPISVDGLVGYPEYTSSKNSIAIIFGSWIYAGNSENSSYSVSSGYQGLAITSTNNVEHRVRSGAAYRVVGRGESISGLFTTSATTADSTAACALGFCVTYD